MAKRIFGVPTISMVAAPDGLLVASQHMTIIPGSATQMIDVQEIYMGGQAASSAVSLMMFARSSTVGITPTALATPNSDGPMNGWTADLVATPKCYITAATQPNRTPAATIARMNMTYNAFGGIVRWVAAPGEEWKLVGTAVNVSETSLSAFTASATASMGINIIYEPF